MLIEISLGLSERLTVVARSKGMAPSDFAEALLAKSLPPEEQVTSDGTMPALSPKNAAALAYLNRRRKEEASDDPAEIRKANAEIDELMQNLNRNRIESGERPLFP